MWKNISNSSYFLLFTHENGYEIYISDYVSVWSTFFTETSFLSSLKESNDILTLNNDKEYILKAVQMLSNPDNLSKHKIETEDDGNTLFVSMTIKFGYPFTFECRLSKGADEIYFQKITQALLKTIKDLRSSQSDLRNLLKKKDKEIDKYKEEGGEIVYRHLKTAAFNDEEHMNKHKLYEENFGGADVPTCLLEKCVELPIKTVKQEPYVQETTIGDLHIKHEPMTPVTEASSSFMSMPVSCKQEVIKTEPKSTINSPRKRMKKLNY